MRIRFHEYLTEVHLAYAITQKFIEVDGKVKSITRKCRGNLSEANGIAFESWGSCINVIIGGISHEQVEELMQRLLTESNLSLDNFPIIRKKQDIKEGEPYLLIWGFKDKEDGVPAFRPKVSNLILPPPLPSRDAEDIEFSEWDEEE